MKKTMGKIFALVIAAVIIVLSFSGCVDAEKFDLANYDTYIISISIEPNISLINNGKTMNFEVVKMNNKYRVTTYDNKNPIYYYIIEDETMFKYQTIYGDFYNRTEVDTFSNEFSSIIVGISDMINNYRTDMSIDYDGIQYIITPETFDAFTINEEGKNNFTLSGKIYMRLKYFNFDYVMGDITINVELNKTEPFVIPVISK